MRRSFTKLAIALSAPLALLVLPLLVRLLVAQAPSAPPPSQAPLPPPTYTLTDLGPLNITAAPSGATALNVSGQVAGFRFENFPSPVCFAGEANRAFLWDQTTNPPYTELRTLGGYSSFAYGINNAGQIVGSSDICPNGTEIGQRAFVWQNGTMTALDPSTNPNDSSIALAVNAKGDVAGYISGPLPVIWKAATIAPSPSGAVRSGNVVTITTTAAHNFAVGDSVTIAGVTDASFDGNFTIAGLPTSTTLTYGQSGADAVSGAGTAWDRVALATLACQFVSCQGKAFAINDAGQAAGWGLGPFVTGPIGSYNANQAVLWDTNGQPTGLGSLGNFFNDQANAINSKGDVVGYSLIDPRTIHAVLWQNGNPQNPQDLGAIPGIDPIFGASANITDNNSAAWGINSKGEIVGVSGAGTNVATQGNGGRAFLYTNGQMYDLLSLLGPGVNWRQLEAAWAINDNGQIVGVGIDANQQEHGFLLTLLITPTSTALSSSVNPSVFGQQVSFTATVTPTSPSPLTPTGNVTFNDGATVLGTVALSSGSAILSTSSLTGGSHGITASYAGDSNFAASASSGVNQVVSQAATSTTLAASPNPANLGQSVTLTATVVVVAPGAGTPTGTVTFLDGTTALGTIAVNPVGNATFTTSSLTTGSHSITASYGSDANFTGSTTTSAVTVTVQGPPPPIQITDNEAIHVADAESFPDIFDAETVKVSDVVTVTPLIDVGAPVAEYSAGSLGFANVAAGQTGTQSLTVSDIGKAPLTLSSATLSAGSAFSVTQVSCSNSATLLPTTLPVGAACIFLISYTAPAGAAANDTLTFTDNAALSNVTGVPAGSSYTQSIPLRGSGSSTPPPPPPPAVVPVIDNETIRVTDTESFPDVFDAETVKVSDAVTVTPLIDVGAPVAEYSAGSLGFANVAAGQTGTQSLTVSDIGKAPLTLSSAMLSGGSAFSVTQVSCSNSATSLPTTLPIGGACIFLISYTAPGGAAGSNTLTFTDNAALSNLASVPAASSYTQSIALNGSGASTPPPPPPPAVIPIVDNETIHVVDIASFPEVFDTEAVHVTDAAFVTPLIAVRAPAADFSAGSLGFSAQSGSQSITVSDIGQAPLTVSSATISGSGQFTITQIACSNGAKSASTTLPSGGACVFTVGYAASATPASDSATLTFTDNAALSNVASVQSGSGYMQSIALSGSGTSTPPPPPPPAVVPVTDSEVITVNDSESFPDVFDAEAITVTDQVAIQIISIATTTSITAPKAPYGTASATVSVSASSGTVIGIVDLSVDGGLPLQMKLAGGSAIFTLATLNAGPHSLSATFAAQGSFAASSASAKMTIDQASPMVSFTGAPSSAAYQSTFTVATKTNATTTATISASGACSITGTTVTMTSGTGTCTLTANWPGDTNYVAAAATQTTAATKIAPAVTFTGAPASAPYNSLFAVTGTTNASTTATITASGACSITGTKVAMTSGTGTCGLLAQWPADSNYLAAATKQSTAATPALSKTTITASSPNPSFVGQALTVKFTVTGNGSPSGNVTVSDGTGDSCTTTVAAGFCSFSITSAGGKTLTAGYGGDTNFASSLSTGVSQTVNKGNTTLTITGHSPSSSVAGQPVTISFVVGVVGPAGGTPTGSVKLSDGVGDTCTASASSGTCSMGFAVAGTKTVTASYSGDGNFNSSTSPNVTQNVTDFTISVKPSSQIVKAGQKTSYNATLAPLNGFAGNVSVSCKGTPPGATCAVSSNSVTLNGSMGMTLSILVQTSKSTPTGSYTLTVKGIFGSGAPTSGGLTHTANFVLTLQ